MNGLKTDDEVAMNVKMKCIRCKKEMVEGFKMILQMGPRGFRRYATCDVCAAKIDPHRPSATSPKFGEHEFRGRSSKQKEMS